MKCNRYFLKKSVESIQAEARNHTLKRSLSATNLVSLGIGCIIGTGIFVLSGQAAAQHAGPAIMLSFVLAGIACAFAALCYAELASVLPISGSAYTYAYATLGEGVAWIMGWLLILEYGVASATVSVGWSGYVVSFLKNLGIVIPPVFTNATAITLADGSVINGIFPVLSSGYLWNALPEGAAFTGYINLPAFVAVLAVTALLVKGVHESAKVNNIIVAIKLAVISIFVLVGVFYIHPANWHPFIPPQTGPGQFGWSGILSGASVIFFAYIGFEAVSTAALEAKNPQRDMPIGILGALGICTVLYMLVSAVLTGIVSYTQLNVADPIAVGVDAIGLPWLSILIKIGAIMGLSSVMLVLVYGQTRIFYTMANDGLIPAVFGKVHPRFHTPYINTMVIGLFVALAGGLMPLHDLGNLVNIGTLVAFCIICFTVLYLRYYSPQLVRPFRVPFSPFVPVLGILFCIGLICGLPKETFHYLGYWLLLGIAVYLLYGQHHSKLAKETV